MVHSSRSARVLLGSRLLVTSVLSLLLRGCGGDDTHGTSDAAVLDAGSLDGGHSLIDASFSDATPVCPALDTVYTFAYSGGLSAQTYYSEISPTGSYRRVRTSGPKVTSCNARLAACGGGGIDQGMLSAAFGDPDVRAAFASATSNLDDSVYGIDPRPVDGAVLGIKRADLKTIGVGDDCNGNPGCRAVPPGVRALASLLVRLDQDQDASGACANF